MSSFIESVDLRTQLAGHNRFELLMFRLKGKQRFGLNVFKIQEVVHCPPLTQIPHSNPVVRGVATFRGKTIPVMDLNMAIGKGEIGQTKGCFVIVTEYNRSMQGFLVGGVDRIINLKWEEIIPPPKGTGKDSYLTAVTRIDGELVEIIDVEKILAEVTHAPTEVSQHVAEKSDELIKQQHVLVVDDSSVARSQIKRTLDQLGIECTLATNGREGLEVLKTWEKEGDPRLARLAMVLSDVEMPEMDGYTFTTEIRKDPRLKGLYILLHTSLSGTFNQAMVERVGADKFVPKFKPDELAAEVLVRVRQFVESKAHG